MKSKLGKTIACAICGKHFQNLTTHISRTHKMDVDAYKKKYGVVHLMSDEVRLKISNAKANGKKNRSYTPMNRDELLRELKKISRKRPDYTPSRLNKEWPSLYNQLANTFGRVGDVFEMIGLSAGSKKKWSKEKVIEAIRKRKRENKSLCVTAMIKDDCALYCAGKYYFDQWDAAVRAAGLKSKGLHKYSHFTDKELLNMAKKSARKAGELLNSEMKKEYRYLPEMLRYRFGTLEAVAERLGVIYDRQRQPRTVKDVKKEVRRWCKENGPLNRAKLSQTDHRLLGRIYTFFGSIKRAAEACRVPATENLRAKGKKWSPEKVIKEIRKLPTLELAVSKNRLLYDAAVRYFGSWSKAVEEAKKRE